MILYRVTITESQTLNKDLTKSQGRKTIFYDLTIGLKLMLKHDFNQFFKISFTLRKLQCIN